MKEMRDCTTFVRQSNATTIKPLENLDKPDKQNNTPKINTKNYWDLKIIFK